LALAARYGFAADAFQVSVLVNPRSLQWTPEPLFADWLGPVRARRPGARPHGGGLVGGGTAVPPHVPLVASEHNQMSWPGGDHTAQA